MNTHPPLRSIQSAEPEEHGSEVQRLKQELALSALVSMNLLNQFDTLDNLTGLPNFKQIEKKIIRQMAYACTRHQVFSILYLNVDNMKMINEIFGYHKGDKVLRALSQVLNQLLCNRGMLAKLGGDEFLLVLENFGHPQKAVEAAKDILDALIHFSLNGEEFFISASIGISNYPRCGETPDQLIKNASMAMRKAKNCGKNLYQIADETVGKYSDVAVPIFFGLRKILPNQELLLLFQPILALADNQCIGFEVLSRWNHPSLGIILPDEFLPYAEAVGAIVGLGRAAIKQAFQSYHRLNLKSPLQLSINLSMSEFMSPGLKEFIQETMNELEIPIHHLIIEITETMMMREPDVVIKKINALNHLGIRISIDDFGMKYSSLNLLKQLPTNFLKIDKSFIAQIKKQDRDAVIVASTIQMAHNLDIKVIAEGVETREELDFLMAARCDYAQGYYFSKPLEFEDLVSYLRKQKLVN